MAVVSFLHISLDLNFSPFVGLNKRYEILEFPFFKCLSNMETTSSSDILYANLIFS